ncbi:MAG: VWA domain-containing protein [Bryobacteraceae bacterium]|jgi:VWFA-related protein
MPFEANLSRRSLLSAFALLPAARLLRGQQPNTTFSAGVKVVNLLATVRDKQGQIVRDLAKEDFLLDEDGHPQTISYFSRETDLPLTLGLLVDTSGSERREIPDERRASIRFLEQVMRPDKDQAFVIHFDFEVELLEDLTNSREKLEKALNQLDTPQLQRQQQGGGGNYPYPGGGQGGQRGGRGRGGGTDLYDAVYLAGDDDTLMKKQKGRKALILLSDGVDTGSKETLGAAVESAQRADTLVYSILFEDPNGYGNNMGGFGGPRMGRRGGGVPSGPGGNRYPTMNRPDGKKILEQISRETGGRFFEVTHKQPIDKVFEAIQEDLRNQYSLGYTSDQQGTDRGYRRIHLTTKQKGTVVQTREGYYPVT